MKKNNEKYFDGKINKKGVILASIISIGLTYFSSQKEINYEINKLLSGEEIGKKYKERKQLDCKKDLEKIDLPNSGGKFCLTKTYNGENVIVRDFSEKICQKYEYPFGDKIFEECRERFIIFFEAYEKQNKKGCFEQFSSGFYNGGNTRKVEVFDAKKLFGHQVCLDKNGKYSLNFN